MASGRRGVPHDQRERQREECVRRAARRDRAFLCDALRPLRWKHGRRMPKEPSEPQRAQRRGRGIASRTTRGNVECRSATPRRRERRRVRRAALRPILPLRRSASSDALRPLRWKHGRGMPKEPSEPQRAQREGRGTALRTTSGSVECRSATARHREPRGARRAPLRPCLPLRRSASSDALRPLR